MTEQNALVKKSDVSLAAGIRPEDFDGLIRFSELAHKSHLAPKGFDTVEKVAIGILTNMELGRPVITGLQDLAIINGRCGIYGDASLAMVTASGLMEDGYPIEKETGTPLEDDWTFSFTVKRIGRPEATGTWNWKESKRAGFHEPKQRDGKPDMYSPWRRFTRRMMQWKARNYVLRDNFGDVLKGMKTVEDLHDLDAVDLSPGPGGAYSVTESSADLGESIKAGEKKDPATAVDEKTIYEGNEQKEGENEQKEGENEQKTENGNDLIDQKNQEILEVQELIAEFNNLKTGFPTWTFKNLERLKSAPQAVKDAHRDKWGRLVQAGTFEAAPWPLDINLTPDLDAGAAEEGPARGSAEQVWPDNVLEHNRTAVEELAEDHIYEMVIEELKAVPRDIVEEAQRKMNMGVGIMPKTLGMAQSLLDECNKF